MDRLVMYRNLRSWLGYVALLSVLLCIAFFIRDLM